jgi:hypothetical protein
MISAFCALLAFLGSLAITPAVIAVISSAAATPINDMVSMDTGPPGRSGGSGDSENCAVGGGSRNRLLRLLSRIDPLPGAKMGSGALLVNPGFDCKRQNSTVMPIRPGRNFGAGHRHDNAPNLRRRIRNRGMISPDPEP